MSFQSLHLLEQMNMAHQHYPLLTEVSMINVHYQNLAQGTTSRTNVLVQIICRQSVC